MYLIPTDDAFVEEIAKSIARERIRKDSFAIIEDITGIKLESEEIAEITFDKVFENLWSGTSPADELNRAGFRRDALAAIGAINLKLITTIE